MNPETATPRLSPSAQYVRNALDRRPRLNYRQLRDMLGYDQKTVYRAIQELRESGIPVDETNTKPKWFSLPQELRRQGQRIVELNEEEILALRLAAQVARSVLAPTPMAGSLNSAFTRLLAEMEDVNVAVHHAAQQSQWHFSDAPSAPIREKVFDLLRAAVLDEQSVLIDYYSASSERWTHERKVDPYCIAERSGSWLLVAWCHNAGELRDFNLVDIEQVVPCDPETDPAAYFEREESFNPDEYFQGRFRTVSRKELYVVRLLVEPHQARYYKRKHYHPTQSIDDVKREDGRIVVSYDVEGLDELRSFAQSWGTGVTVLEPEELRTIMREQAAEILERYERS